MMQHSLLSHSLIQQHQPQLYLQFPLQQKQDLKACQFLVLILVLHLLLVLEEQLALSLAQPQAQIQYLVICQLFQVVNMQSLFSPLNMGFQTMMLPTHQNSLQAQFPPHLVVLEEDLFSPSPDKDLIPLLIPQSLFVLMSVPFNLYQTLK